MPNPTGPAFTPQTIEDVFAVFLARELSDTPAVRSYASLARRYSLCLLLNALRQARRDAAGQAVSPTHFLAAMRALVGEKIL